MCRLNEVSSELLRNLMHFKLVSVFFFLMIHVSDSVLVFNYMKMILNIKEQ